MKSEDLLKAIGEIDEKFIEEAAPKDNIVVEAPETALQESDNKKLVEVAKVKHKNTFRIVASIAACVCLVTAVCFAIVGSTKSKPQTSDEKISTEDSKVNDDGVSYLEENPDEEDYKGINSQKTEIYELKWSERDNSQKYTDFSIDGYTYTTANTETSDEYIGEKLCDISLTGTDDNDSKQKSTGTAYKINGISDKFVVAVKFKDDSKCYVYIGNKYRNSKYTPKNLGEFIDDLGLAENLRMCEIGLVYNVYEEDENGEKNCKEIRYYNSISKADIWNKLLYNRNIESLTDFSNGPYIQDGYYASYHYGYYITISAELPIINFGARNFRIIIADDGYIVFNLGYAGRIAFKLSDEQIKDFKAMLDEKEYLNEEGMNLHYGWDLGETVNITPKITSSAVRAIKPGMTYSEVIHQLGKGANFGKMNMQQYIVDDEYAMVLKFDDFSDICTKSGEELLEDIVPYKKPERVESILAKDYDIFYCIVTNDNFVSFRDNHPDIHYELDLSNAKIEFENGEPATANDIKFMSTLVISFNNRLATDASKLYCTKVIIISNDSENSDSDTSFDEITTESKKISSSDVKAIKAGMTYKEIISKLGESANFGHFGMRQYILDDSYVLSLKFNKLTDVCTKSGVELLADMVSYKVPERLSDKAKDNPIYGIVTDNKFISCVNNNPSTFFELDLSDAEIKFENGEPATADDIKLMSGVVVIFDNVAEIYPPQIHCTSVTIVPVSPYMIGE